MLEQLHALGDVIDRLLDYNYPPIDVTPVLLLSQLDYRAQQRDRLSGMHTSQRLQIYLRAYSHLKAHL